MSYSVSGTTITLTRGDTFVVLISIIQQYGIEGQLKAVEERSGALRRYL